MPDVTPTAAMGWMCRAARMWTAFRPSGFSRPDDERYLSLDGLFASVKGRAERSRTRTVESAAIRVEAHRDDPEKLGLVQPGGDEPIAPTHWSFGQLSNLVGAPAAYLRQLPAPLAGINLQYGLTNHRAEQIKTMEVADDRTELRAVTGPDYGRISDHELVSAVQRIAGNGTGDTRWKVPGVLDWSTGIYNPRVDVTKETTTLYASDRDVFLFLVDTSNNAAIHHDSLPGDHPRSSRRKPHRRFRDVTVSRAWEALDRLCLRDPVCVLKVGAFGDDASRRNGIYPDSTWSHVAGHSPRHAYDACLGGMVGCKIARHLYPGA